TRTSFHPNIAAASAVPSHQPPECSATSTLFDWDGKAALSLSDLKHARSLAQWYHNGGENYRTVLKSGTIQQYGYTQVNQCARKLKIDKLDKGKAVVVGAIRFAHQAGADQTYRVAEGIPYDDQELRHFIFIVYRPDGYPTPTNDNPKWNDRYIAEWAMYQIVDGPQKGDRQAQNVGHGKIRECGHPTGGADPSVSQAQFTRCDGAPAIQAIANRPEFVRHSRNGQSPVFQLINLFSRAASQNGVSFHEQLHYERCRLGEDTTCVPKDKTVRAATRAFADLTDVFPITDSSRRSMLSTLFASGLDAMIDPYWFSCGAGCCTADI
ncbi:MAG: hypothetical protein ABI442_03445, partial [Gemmatimonadaceae bacterium]